MLASFIRGLGWVVRVSDQCGLFIVKRNAQTIEVKDFVQYFDQRK